MPFWSIILWTQKQIIFIYFYKTIQQTFTNLPSKSIEIHSSSFFLYFPLPLINTFTHTHIYIYPKIFVFEVNWREWHWRRWYHTMCLECVRLWGTRYILWMRQQLCIPRAIIWCFGTWTRERKRSYRGPRRWMAYRPLPWAPTRSKLRWRSASTQRSAWCSVWQVLPLRMPNPHLHPAVTLNPTSLSLSLSLILLLLLLPLASFCHCCCSCDFFDFLIFFKNNNT